MVVRSKRFLSTLGFVALLAPAACGGAAESPADDEDLLTSTQALDAEATLEIWDPVSDWSTGWHTFTAGNFWSYDNSPVTKVQWFLDGVEICASTATSPPNNCSWYAPAGQGNHVIKAVTMTSNYRKGVAYKAFTRNGGTGVNVDIWSPTTPPNSMMGNWTHTLVAGNFSTPDGSSITRVQWFIDNVEKCSSTSYNVPNNCSWTAPDLIQASEHDASVRVTTSSGKVAYKSKSFWVDGNQGIKYGGWISQSNWVAYCNQDYTLDSTLTRQSGDVLTRGGGACFTRRTGRACPDDTTVINDGYSCLTHAQAQYGAGAYGYCFTGICYSRPGTQADKCVMGPNRSSGVTLSKVLPGSDVKRDGNDYIINCMTKAPGPSTTCGGTDMTQYMRYMWPMSLPGGC